MSIRTECRGPLILAISLSASFPPIPLRVQIYAVLLREFVFDSHTNVPVSTIEQPRSTFPHQPNHKQQDHTWADGFCRLIPLCISNADRKRPTPRPRLMVSCILCFIDQYPLKVILKFHPGPASKSDRAQPRSSQSRQIRTTAGDLLTGGISRRCCNGFGICPF